MRAKRFARSAALLALIGAAACASAPPAPAPDTAESYADFLVGRLANLREDHGAAAARYYQALTDPHADPALLQQAINASLAAGEADRARQIAAIAQERHADAPLADLVRGADALAAGRWRAARENLARVHGSAAEELCQRVMTAWVRAGERRTEAASDELERIVTPPPFSGMFLYQRAMVLDYAGQTDEALAAYEEADAAGLWLPPAMVRHADLLFRSGAREEAEALLRDASAQSFNAELEAAYTRVSAGQAPAERALTPAYGAAVGLYGLGALFLRDADSSSGLASFTLALMLDAQFDAARMAFAETQIGLKHYEAGRAALGEIGAASPYATNAAMSDAWALMDMGRKDEAGARAEEAAAGSDNPRVRRLLAEMYSRLGRYGEAETIYTELVDQAGPKGADWRLLFARGVARQELGRPDEAEADVQRALEVAPDQPELLNYLGYSWVDRGVRLTEGLALIERALALRPHSGAIIDSLGWAYYRMGDWDNALVHLERAVELEPTDPTLHDHLGDVYWRLGRRIEARFQWRHALSFDPPAEAREAIAAKLEAGLAPIRPSASATR